MELKAETIIPQGTTISLQMYPKAEVDNYIKNLEDKLRHYPIMVKLISLKDKDIAELKDKLEKSVSAHNEIFDELHRTIEIKEELIDKVTHQDKKLRHRNYQYCLSRAEFCKEELDKMQCGYYKIDNGHEVMSTCPPQCNPKYDFYIRWKKNWTEIAEKFKV